MYSPTTSFPASCPLSSFPWYTCNTWSCRRSCLMAYGKWMKMGSVWELVSKFLVILWASRMAYARFNHPSYSTNGWRLCQRCCLCQADGSVPKKWSHDVPLNWLIKGGPISPYISPDHERNHMESPPCKWLDAVQLLYIILRAFQERHVCHFLWKQSNFREVNPSVKST